MSATERIIHSENENGVALTLKIDMHKNSPETRIFTISYKAPENRSSSRIWFLILAVFFNILAVLYVKITFTALMIIIIVLTFLIYFWMSHSVQSESVLVIPSVGIQSTVKYVYGEENAYFPWRNVEDVIINECLKLNRVLYCLSILVRDFKYEEEAVLLVPLFKHTRPRLHMLETMYSELQDVLTAAHARSTRNEEGDKNIG